MRPEILIIIGIFISFALVEALRTGFINKRGEINGDKQVEITSSLMLMIIIQPFILFSAHWLGGIFFPNYSGALSTLPIYGQFALLLIFDDMSQYWWHRASHNVSWLYKLHRPHHNAEYISVRLIYRNNIFYYFLMPGLWFSGLLIYFGLGWAYAFYIIVKLLVITGAHSDVPWDRPLYRVKWLQPFMWIVERTISTPSTHSMHHGKHKDDGVTHYKGNYGNLLFFWDVLFGTAKISRKRPEKFGVEDLPETTIAEQLVWPVIKSSKPISESAD